MLLGVVYFDLLLAIINIQYSWIRNLLVLNISLVQTLLDKLVGVQLFGNLHTQLKVFGHKVFKLFSSKCLSLALVLDVVVVFHNLFAAFPVHLNDVAHKLAFALEVLLYFTLKLLLGCLLLTNMFLALFDHFLRIAVLLLAFLVEVVGHPIHLFY
jgi:hypothetical protein